MSGELKLEIKALGGRLAGDVVMLLDQETLARPKTAPKAINAATMTLLAKAAAIEGYKAKLNGVLTVLAGANAGCERVLALGLGPRAERAKIDWATLGGALYGKLGKGRAVTVLFETGGQAPTADDIADFALGLRLRAYQFDRYKTKSGEEAESGPASLVLQVAEPTAVKKALKARDAVAEGAIIARDLVNEPPNVLSPEEFAKRASELSRLGVAVEVLDDRKLAKIGMRALLAVGQGSERGSRVVIMRWNGGKASDKPVAFVGKGVVFDTGGISIKPAQGMEDMKGDMAGAACVVGLMHALASRKAKVNAVGAIGLVENMPDGKAQRPGDIVTSLSGQTIEIINTDAEGRLVLADVLWHVKETIKPRFIIDLATLTGAILVALGHEHAGLFSNDDDLAQRLEAAGKATGETVWRMPIGPAYDKQIDSKFADMKNAAGRYGGSITAAQFLKRFVGETPWAHLDIAGTGMSSPQTEINKSWASGWGVRLLDRLVDDLG